MKAAMGWLLAAVALTTVTLRILGPSDLNTKDQPRTVAYTVDMLQNHRWLWPLDMEGVPTYKPPLYNYLDAAVVGTTGVYDDWTFKLPSLLAGLATTLIVIVMAKRMTPASDKYIVTCASLLAGILWLANFSTIRLIYIARPDMLLCFFLVASWALATILLSEPRDDTSPPNPNRRRAIALLLWICVGLAALTKGPPAFLPVIFILVNAPLTRGRIGAVRDTGILWGLPLAVGIFALWGLPAYLTIPAGFGQTLANIEYVRLTNQQSGNPYWLNFILTLWQNPFYFLARFAVWAVLFIWALVHIKPARWMRHPMGPAILWVFLVLIFYLVPSLKRDDYLIPAFAPAAIVAAWFCVIELGKARPAAAVLAGCVGLAICLGSAVNDLALRPQHGEPFGDNVRNFALEVRQHVAPDESIAFIHTGYHPLQSYLARNQPSREPTDEQRASAKWIIQPIVDAPNLTPIVTSAPLPQVIDRREPARLGLYSTPSP
ncbi:MAG: hypothetical protein GC162_06610 [Planctomycetes bacterium]|nr:hypothetical protein [Planctomycetota bacterium]